MQQTLRGFVTGAFLVVYLALAACGESSTPPIPESDASTDVPVADAAVSQDPPVTADASSLGDASFDAALLPPDFATEGPLPVGHARIVITDRTGTRKLPVQLWYPAQESARAGAATGVGIESFEGAGTPERATLEALVSAAPATCTRKVQHSVPNVPPTLPTSGLLPLVVFSHCHNCVRFSQAVIAERLASHGIAMAAPDHVTNTIYDHAAELDEAFLKVRASDIGSVLDTLLSPTSMEVPDALRGHFDPARVGGLGHSFGAITIGRVLRDDPRVKAGFVIAAPFDSPMLSGAKPSDIQRPLFFLLAREDNSITEVGNFFIRSNFKQATPPAWLAEVADTGHWSFSDIAGMKSDFAPGCGEGKRQTVLGGPKFNYLGNELARGIAQRYAAAFFGYTLLGDERAHALLDQASPQDTVTLQARK